MATAAHRDLSAGAWRPLVFGADVRRWPAVHPQHERRKYFHAGVGRPSWISRFAGLGRYGTAKLQRAAVLAEAGFTPQPVRISRGMLTEEWIEAPTPPSDLRLRGGWIDRLAAYVAFLRRTFATGRRAQVDDLAAMIDQNMREAFGVKRPATDRLIRTACAFDEPEVAIDGRMLPHEWLIDAADRAIKTDALDHHADDFLPGSCDAAWDIAGAVVEFALDGSATARLIQRYRELSGDMTIAARLSFYRTAYLAYRTGYASLAADTLRGSADGVRFARLTAHYRRLLAGPAPPRR